MTIYQTKKLSLDTEKTEILKKALSEATPQDRYMSVIYQQTLQQITPGADRIMLLPAQIGVVDCALRRYCHVHGDDARAIDMLRQLTLSRRAYAAHAELQL